jgi:2-polyprenyl-3-methyl-5-hydroxy-6-metoxy-1,4-benzoquinol methylase
MANCKLAEKSEARYVMATKVDRVRSIFEKPSRYLGRRAFEVKIRAETVGELTRVSPNTQILDIGCGDGSVSLSLLRMNTRVTLLDLSSNMLSIARSKIPLELAENVETINQDFMSASLLPESFDLILCIGVLAHVVSPKDFIAKMVSLLKPEGKIVLECTDAHHFVTKLVFLFYKFWRFIKPTKCALNTVSFAEIIAMLERHNMQRSATFRYIAPLPGIYRLLSQESLYKLTRWIFGTSSNNRNTWLGNECISLFISKQVPERGNLRLDYREFK